MSTACWEGVGVGAVRWALHVRCAHAAAAVHTPAHRLLPVWEFAAFRARYKRGKHWQEHLEVELTTSSSRRKKVCWNYGNQCPPHSTCLLFYIITLRRRMYTNFVPIPCSLTSMYMYYALAALSLWHPIGMRQILSVLIDRESTSQGAHN
jgi:hypothetical protein